MRRILTVLALTLTLVGIATPAYAGAATPSGRHWAHHHHGTATSLLVLERRASPIQQVAPFVDPEPTFPLVTVYARLRGCEPGRLYVASTRFFQNRREITGIAGGRGFGEFVCGANGTARIAQARFDPAGLLHPGRMRVYLEVVAFDGGAVLASATARVRIPRR
jgi:hypothetical protein